MIERQTMSVQEVAEYLGVSRDLVYSMAKAGKLPKFTVGRRILFKRESLERWMQMQEMREQTEIVSQPMEE